MDKLMTLPLIQIYDTTLRDGTQSEGFTLSSNDKVRVAQRLDAFGVAFIEGGWPGSNPKDVEFFERARDIQWKNALIAAFGYTCRVKGGPEDDANIKALIDSQTPVCTIFGKTWTLHVKEVLQTTNEDNLRIIEHRLLISRRMASVSFMMNISLMATKQTRYALETLRTVRGGLETVVLCDTNGGTMPWEVERIIRELKPALEHPFGIHTHVTLNALRQFLDGSP
jgi:2-isopropylmalate synthase